MNFEMAADNGGVDQTFVTDDAFAVDNST